MILVALGAAAGQARKSGKDLPLPVQLTTQQDHQRTMQLLGITSLRPGANGTNPQAPNYANYDESKANPYPDLPDPMTLKNGR